MPPTARPPRDERSLWHEPEASLAAHPVHPDVAEAAVIAVADERWQERPLACVVAKTGSGITPEALQAFLADRVAKWWLPERWAVVEEIPKTSVGKFDKKALRTRLGEGQLEVVDLRSADAHS